MKYSKKQLDPASSQLRSLITPETNYHKCDICGSTKTYVCKKTGVEAWHSGKCSKCYVRLRGQKNIPKNVKCKRCQKHTTYVNKYDTPVWVRDKKEPGTYFCKSCSITIRNTGHKFTPEQKRTLSAAMRKAYEDGKLTGFKKIHTFYETVFDEQTEERDYWLGFLITDGNIYLGNGNPRLTLKLGVKDLNHLIKFKEFLKCSNPITKKIEIARGKQHEIVNMRLSIPRKIAEKLASFGVTAQKTHSAKVIGLENSRHFWRGVVDGDGHLKNRDGRDTDIIVLTGASYDLVVQLEGFIKCNIEGAEVTIKAIEENGRYSKLYRIYVYSDTARMLAKLLYDDCHIALDRKLSQAQEMFRPCLWSRPAALLHMEKKRDILYLAYKLHRHLTQRRTGNR